MAADPSYYNMDYAAIHQDYLDAENRSNVSSNQEIELSNRAPQRTPKPKRISRKDSQNYDLCDEESTSPPPSQTSHRRNNDSASDSKKNGNKLSWLTWKSFALSAILIGILVGAGVTFYFVADLKGYLAVT